MAHAGRGLNRARALKGTGHGPCDHIMEVDLADRRVGPQAASFLNLSQAAQAAGLPAGPYQW